jgi:hypothetical protein
LSPTQKQINAGKEQSERTEGNTGQRRQEEVTREEKIGD